MAHLGYNKRLDAIRGIAVIAVICFHWHLFFPYGWMGVQVFFVLSGFLITTILREEKTPSNGLFVYVKEFVRRRALRILPLYYAFVGINGLAWYLVGHPKTFDEAYGYLFTFTLNFARMFPDYTNTTYSHLWSLAVEWQFYVVWPFVVWRATDRGLFWLLVAFVICGPLMRYITVLELQATSHSLDRVMEICYNATWSHIDSFAMGALLGWEKCRRVFGRTTFLALCVLALLLLDFTTANMSRVVIGFSFLNLASAALIAATWGGAWWMRVADIPIVQYVGKISYGVYVYHVPIVMMGTRFVLKESPLYSSRSAVGLLFAILLSIGLAHLSYVLFEQRFLRQKMKKSIKTETIALSNGNK